MLTAISDTIRLMAAMAPMPAARARAETSVLSRALDRAAVPAAPIVLAEGRTAGIGKTRLLAETLTHARERGSGRPGRARRDDSRRRRPFGVIGRRWRVPGVRANLVR